MTARCDPCLISPRLRVSCASYLRTQQRDYGIMSSASSVPFPFDGSICLMLFPFDSRFFLEYHLLLTPFVHYRQFGRTIACICRMPAYTMTYYSIYTRNKARFVTVSQTCDTTTGDGRVGVGGRRGGGGGQEGACTEDLQRIFTRSYQGERQ